MTIYKYILTFFLGLIFSTTAIAQTPGTIWSNNITLKCVTNFSRGGSADVWGWKDNQTGKHYALFILNKNLSIVDTISTLEPAYPAYRTGR